MRNGFILNIAAIVLLAFVTALLLIWPRLEPDGYEGPMYRPQHNTTQDTTIVTEPPTDPDPTTDLSVDSTTDPTIESSTDPTAESVEGETTAPPTTQPQVGQDGYFNQVIKP